MAVSVTNLTSDRDSGALLSSSTTASISPSANKLILLTVVVRNGLSTDPTTPTISGNSLTWQLINSVIYDNASGSRKGIFLFRAMGASPTTGAVTITYGETESTAGWIIDEVSGMATTGTNGSGAIVQSAVNSEPTNLVTSLTVTLGAFSSSGNATYGAFGFGNGTDTITAGSGFTQVDFQQDTIDNNLAVFTEFRNDNDTSVDITFPSNAEVGGVAIEIKADSLSIAINPTNNSYTGVRLI